MQKKIKHVPENIYLLLSKINCIRSFSINQENHKLKICFTFIPQDVANLFAKLSQLGYSEENIEYNIRPWNNIPICQTNVIQQTIVIKK